jgi:hypothetical protein
MRGLKSPAHVASLAASLGAAAVLDCRRYISPKGPWTAAVMKDACAAEGVSYQALHPHVTTPDGVRRFTGRVLAVMAIKERGADTDALAIGDAFPGQTVHIYASSTTIPVADLGASTHEELKAAIADPTYKDPLTAIQWWFVERPQEGLAEPAAAATPEESAVSPEAVLAGLKDFQRTTVHWVFDRLYGPGSSGRYLVADEVGLGKTLVARGVIARAIEHLRAKNVKRIDVLYICSNSDIARQNIQRLKLDGDGHVTLASRLTMMPLEVAKLKKTRTGVNFISFTPSTSFDVRDGLGQARERVLLYWMVITAWALKGTKALQHVFRGNVGPERFSALVDEFDVNRVDEDAQTAFTEALTKELEEARVGSMPTLREKLEVLCRAYSRADRTIDRDTSRERSRFIGELRNVLAGSCVGPLEPDLVILDEFQRFAHLLDDKEDDVSALARAVFNYPDVRVLLLSATPYKMYTLTDDREDHYRDFVRTLKFLEGTAGDQRPIEDDLEEYRAALLGVAQLEGTERLRLANRRLEERLRRVMVRTERLASTVDRNGMLKVVGAPLELRTSDVLDYHALQNVARIVDHHDTMEFWKSAPYALNFLDDEYKLKAELRELLDKGEGRMKVARALAPSSTATLPWDAVYHYREVDAGNPRMRALVRDVVETGAHRLLWVPPAMPYYALGGPFADPRVARFTKRLVFSSWKVAPRAIAAMMSYEVERRIFGVEPGAEYSPEYRAARKPALRFARADGRLTGMAVLALLYPSLYLAEMCDPAVIASEIAEERTRDDRPCGARDVRVGDVIDVAKNRIQVSIDRHLPRAREDGPVDERWYWAAPLLLDRKLNETATLGWFEQTDLAKAWSGVGDDAVDESDEKSRDQWTEHVEAARDVALGGPDCVTSADGRTALGKMPDDLVDVLAQLAMGGPAVAMFRALLHVVGRESRVSEAGKIALRNGAGSIAWAMRALFNQPEVMTLLRTFDRRDASPYWRKVLKYCVDGCLQAVLEEYVHVLRDHLGLLAGTEGERVGEIAAEMVEAIELRRSHVGIDHLERSEAGKTVSRSEKNMRTHFALRYGDERSEDGMVVTRADRVRKAFNSPFWPFVLATTSVGQEGLDFHTYCHAVVHWNLPSNPVDLEQREGRVHRFKGHAVRKNVAGKHGDEALAQGSRDRWELMFELASSMRPEGTSEIVPFWVYQGEAHIERHVPSLPLSRDSAREQRLRASLAVYRMVFGQPRQDDLVAYLLERVPAAEREKLAQELRIDLSPGDHSTGSRTSGETAT